MACVALACSRVVSAEEAHRPALDQLRLEIQKEEVGAKGRFVPVQVESTLMILAAVNQLRASCGAVSGCDAGSFSVGMVTGAAWLGASIYLAGSYMPYRSGWQEISALQASAPLSEQSRDRLAAHVIEDAGRVGRRLTLSAFATFFGASLFMIHNAPGDSSAVWTDLLALSGSLIPVVWAFRWQSVDSQLKRDAQTPSPPVVSLAPLTGSRAGPGAQLALTWQLF